MSTVETARLVLRPWREADRDELERLFNDPAVRGNRAFPPGRIAAAAEASRTQWEKHGFGPWAVIDKATGRWVGRAGLDELDDWPFEHRIEVGFELGREWWGRGYATEIARAALRFAFRDHRLARIISVTAAAHTAARRVMEKAGLTYQGTRFWKSPDVAVVWYAIDRGGWEAANP